MRLLVWYLLALETKWEERVKGKRAGCGEGEDVYPKNVICAVNWEITVSLH